MKKQKILPTLALLAALGFVVSGVTHFLMPKEQIHFAHGISGAFFVSLSHNAAAFHVHYWAFALGALFATGILLHSIGQNETPFALKITGAWALAGLLLIAVDFARMHAQAMHSAGEFARLSPTAQSLVLARGLDRLDPYGLAFTLIGLHLIYLNYRYIRRRTLALWIGWLGLAGGFLLQFVLIGTVVHLGILIDLAAGLGGIVLFPVWLIAYGWRHPALL